MAIGNRFATHPVTLAYQELGHMIRSLLIGSFCLSLVPFLLCTNAEAAEKPNIVIFFVDDLGWCDVSSDSTTLGHASKLVDTPTVERLAAQGMSFTAAYTQQNCAPTRAALLTGQYAPLSGVYNVGSVSRPSKAETGKTKIIPPEVAESVGPQAVTYAETLAQVGYQNAIFGKVHGWGQGDKREDGFQFDYHCNKTVSREGTGKKRKKLSNYYAYNDDGTWRFDSEKYKLFAKPYDNGYVETQLAPVANGNDPKSLIGNTKHFTDAIGDAAVAFLDQIAEQEQPFSMWVSYHAIHSGIVGREDLIAKYRQRLPDSSQRTIKYLALTEQMDQTTARVLAALDRHDLADNTLVIFMSDNGGVPSGNNGPLAGNKGMFTEGGIRVPMIARLPGRIEPGSVCHEPVHVIDFYPTFAELAGAQLPDPNVHPLSGESLAPLLQGTATQLNRTTLHWHFPGYMDTRQIPNTTINRRVGEARYKLRYFYEDNRYAMYNLSTDIGESNDLLASNPSADVLSTANLLRADMLDWLNSMNPEPMRFRDSGHEVPLPGPLQ